MQIKEDEMSEWTEKEFEERKNEYKEFAYEEYKMWGYSINRDTRDNLIYARRPDGRIMFLSPYEQEVRAFCKSQKLQDSPH